MISKKSRLAPKEFHSSGYRSVRTPYFLLKIKKSTDGTPKIGIVVGKGVHKSAVKRNFWKRQAKKTLGEEAKVLQNSFLLILASKVNGLTKKQFEKEIIKAARAAK